MAPVIAPRSLLARAVAQEAVELDPRSSSAAVPLDTTTLPRLLSPRLDDNANIVPDTYGAPSGPDAGTVVGIVLGSVGGFLLILWLIYSITNLGNRNAVVETASVGTASVVTRKSRKHHSRRRRHSSASRPRETVEVRRTERVVPVPMPQGATTTERIVVEERSRSRAPPPPMPMPPPPRVVHDDDDDDDDEDEVVVIEEHTPPRRRDKHHKRRDSRRSSERRRSSGYRDVDPYRYAGGDASVRSVSRRRSPSRGR